MPSEYDADMLAESVLAYVTERFNDKKWTQEQSASLWSYLADESRNWEHTIEKEMEEG